MKKLVLLVFILFLIGCSNSTVKTPPWNNKELEQLQQDNIETIPVLVVRF